MLAGTGSLLADNGAVLVGTRSLLPNRELFQADTGSNLANNAPLLAGILPVIHCLPPVLAASHPRVGGTNPKRNG